MRLRLRAGVATVNIDRFRELADTIERADRFDMRYVKNTVDGVAAVDSNKPDRELFTDCGTVGCVAGWALALWHRGSLALSWPYWCNDAAKPLDLTREQASRLFLADEYSVWAKHAERYGWAVDEDGIDGWEQITATQAAHMLREIADGTVTL